MSETFGANKKDKPENQSINKGLEHFKKEVQSNERLYKALPEETYKGLVNVLKQMPYQAVEKLIKVIDLQVRDVVVNFKPESEKPKVGVENISPLKP
jgi:hypothetical protein